MWRIKLQNPLTSGEDQLKERLLKAATEVFLEKGFAATSVDEIASRAKASKLTFYNHFGNKEKLFEAIVMRLNSTMFKGFADALEADVPMEQGFVPLCEELGGDALHRSGRQAGPCTSCGSCSVSGTRRNFRQGRASAEPMPSLPHISNKK